MKKKILSIFIAAMAVCAISSNAQAPANRNAACNSKDNKECVEKNGRQCAFEGITLSADQQAKIAELQKARKDRRDGMRKERRDDRRMRDSIARNDRREYLSKVKNILTPEQYVAFLENIAVNQGNPDRQGGRPGASMQKGKRDGGHRGAPGQRPAPGSRDAARK